MSGKAMDLTTAMTGSKPATSRPLTSMGRYVAQLQLRSIPVSATAACDEEGIANAG